MMKTLLFLLALMLSFTVAAQDTEQEFNDEQLAQMLAPIALYPDSLLTHILIASTYPVEVIEAQRWAAKNEKLNAEDAATLVEAIDWEPSVKALVPFPSILKRLSEDLSWTRQLGDAFLQDEERLLQSIQNLRQQAEQAGSLDKIENMKVSRAGNNIIIQPIEKEIVYVPYYDTRMVYGTWYWPSYPPVYWSPYHAVYLTHHNPFYWHSGIHISFNYFFSAFHWHNRHVVVIDHHHTRYHRQRRYIVHEGYANRWKHQPHHRKGVAYRNNHLKKIYHSNRASVHKTNQRRQHERVILANNKVTRNSYKKSHVVSGKTYANKVNHHAKTVARQHKQQVNRNMRVSNKRHQNTVKNNHAKKNYSRNVSTSFPKTQSSHNKQVIAHKPAYQKTVSRNKKREYNESKSIKNTEHRNIRSHRSNAKQNHSTRQHKN